LPTVIAAGGTITTIGGVALSKINTAKQKVTEVSTAANSQIDGLLSEKNKIAEQYETTKTTLTDKEKQLSEMTQRTAEAEKLNDESATIVSGYKSEIETLKKEKLELLDKIAHTPVNVVEVVK
jgi:Skp family chaperone for outer membrane proteins